MNRFSQTTCTAFFSIVFGLPAWGEDGARGGIVQRFWLKINRQSEAGINYLLLRPPQNVNNDHPVLALGIHWLKTNLLNVEIN